MADRVLIIDADMRSRTVLGRALRAAMMVTEAAVSGEDGIERIAQAEYDLVLLDIDLPGIDGFHVIQTVRQRGSRVPMVVVSSHSEDYEQLYALDLGADDYVTKPFNPQVLLARIQNLLARTAAPEAGAVLTHKGLTLYVLQAKMRCGDKEAELTRNELGILRLLMRSKGNVIPRDAIIDELWQSEAFIDENTLNVNIVRLRKKLAAIGLPDYLETKRGMGYKV